VETFSTREREPGVLEVVSSNGTPVITVSGDLSDGTISMNPTQTPRPNGPLAASNPMPLGCAHALRDSLSRVIDWVHQGKEVTGS
jgi:hypothetical protein